VTWTAADSDILLLSLKVALWSVAASLPLALGVAWLLARTQFRGKVLFDAVVHLPLVLPPVVIGFALLLLFGRNGWIGAPLEQWFGLVFAFKWTGAALASAIMGFPLMVRAIRLSLEAIDPRLESAARTLGASPWRVHHHHAAACHARPRHRRAAFVCTQPG
jgi:molybdate transport system permease protein